MNKPQDILIIEDDEWFAQQQSRSLLAAGFSVRYATDGITAITLLDENIPAAIVLDMFLPGPNALVLLHEIQSYSDLSKIPVIICSGSASDLPLASLASYGVADVIDKNSMKPDDIVRAVRRVLV